MESIQLPKISKEYIETLIKLFPVRSIKPNTRIEDIMYEAGRQEVIQFIKRHAQYDVVLGEVPDKPVQVNVRKNFLSRWFK